MSNHSLAHLAQAEQAEREKRAAKQKARDDIRKRARARGEAERQARSQKDTGPRTAPSRNDTPPRNTGYQGPKVGGPEGDWDDFFNSWQQNTGKESHGQRQGHTGKESHGQRQGHTGNSSQWWGPRGWQEGNRRGADSSGSVGFGGTRRNFPTGTRSTDSERQQVSEVPHIFCWGSCNAGG